MTSRGFEEDCPGEGRCHGCVQWCYACGDVGRICDSPSCDSHRRTGELRSDLEAVRLQLSESVRRYRRLECAWIGSWTPPSAPRTGSDEKDALRALSSAANEVKWLEKEYLEAEQAVSDAEYWERRGAVMAPRSPGPPEGPEPPGGDGDPVGRQLLLKI